MKAVGNTQHSGAFQFVTDGLLDGAIGAEVDIGSGLMVGGGGGVSIDDMGWG